MGETSGRDRRCRFHPRRRHLRCRYLDVNDVLPSLVGIEILVPGLHGNTAENGVTHCRPSADLPLHVSSLIRLRCTR